MPALLVSNESSALATRLARMFLQEAKAKVQKAHGRLKAVGKPQFSVLAPFGLAGHPPASTLMALGQPPRTCCKMRYPSQ